MPLYQFTYNGPVKSFDNILTSRWKAETNAFSEARARSNLAYRYKKEHGLSESTKITLTGSLTCRLIG